MVTQKYDKRKVTLCFFAGERCSPLPESQRPRQKPKQKIYAPSAFSFAYAGAKEKAIKKENAERRFRALRSATKTPRPRPRKPLKRLDLNFMVSENFVFGLQKRPFTEKEIAKSPEKSGLFVYFFARASITGLTNRKSNIPTARIAAIPRISVHSFASFSPYWRTALCFASSEM